MRRAPNPATLPARSLACGTRVVPTFPRDLPDPVLLARTAGARKRGRVPRKCVHEPGTRRARAACSCSGSGLGSYRSPLKSATKPSRHREEEITNFLKPGPDPEAHSPHAGRDSAGRRPEQWPGRQLSGAREPKLVADTRDPPQKFLPAL